MLGKGTGKAGMHPGLWEGGPATNLTLRAQGVKAVPVLGAPPLAASPSQSLHISLPHTSSLQLCLP